jgi:hypothetical protein
VYSSCMSRDVSVLGDKSFPLVALATVGREQHAKLRERSLYYYPMANDAGSALSFFLRCCQFDAVTTLATRAGNTICGVYIYDTNS